MNILAPESHVYTTSDVRTDLASLLASRDAKQTFLLTDEGSEKYCTKLIDGLDAIPAENRIVISAGDDYKDYRAALKIWEHLSSHGATRKALLICLGGGMPCDLGGFCASTFKRGIEFINIPTTLLSQVDASLGGKTGMNLGSLKNEIGVFSKASHVLICADFLKTLDHANILSGFAEMIKHGLIHKADAVDRLLNFDFDNVDYPLLQQYVGESILIKEYFVKADPTEKGIRKALNFGHTFGHAFETYSMRHNKPILHGYAVAYGMVCEVLMSRDKVGLDAAEAQRIANKIFSIYGHVNIDASATDELIELMHHDKKNDAAGINFTLLPKIGEVQINQIGSPDEIKSILNTFFQINK